MKVLNAIFYKLCLLVHFTIEAFKSKLKVEKPKEEPKFVSKGKAARKSKAPPAAKPKIPIKKLIEDEFVDVELEELLKILNRHNK